MNIKHMFKYRKYKIWDGEWCVDVRWSERLENRQGVTSVKGETDQVMLMGRNCSLMDCKMGCDCGLMDGAAWLRLRVRVPRKPCALRGKAAVGAGASQVWRPMKRRFDARMHVRVELMLMIAGDLWHDYMQVEYSAHFPYSEFCELGSVRNWLQFRYKLVKISLQIGYNFVTNWFQFRYKFVTIWI